MRLKPLGRGGGKDHAEGTRGDSKGRGGQDAVRVAQSGDTACFRWLHTHAGGVMKPGQRAQRASSARRQVEKFLHPRATENSGDFTQGRDENGESFQKGNLTATRRAHLRLLNPEQTFEANVKSSVLGLWGCWASSSHWP